METPGSYFEYVRQMPWYRELYRDVDRAEDAPSLDKETLLRILKEHFDPAAETEGVYLVRSGGSTQKPLVFPVDIRENLQQRDILAARLRQEGILKAGTVGLNLFTYGLMYRTASILDDLLERCSATSLPLSAEAKNADVFEAIRQFRPGMLLGSPSRLALLARYLQENKQKVEVPDLLFGGEFMLPSYEKIFINEFKILNIYGLYGSAESGIWGWSHYSKEPGLYRVIDPVHIEIGDADAEGFGQILVTNLLRKRFPVFRYKLGDIGRLQYRNGIRYLELRSRENKSFFIDSSNMYLDDFREITEGAEAFQMQLLRSEDLKHIVRLLLVKPLAEAEKKAFEERCLQQMRALMHLSPSLVQTEVKLCTTADLYMNPVTAKIPQLVDFRD